MKKHLVKVVFGLMIGTSIAHSAEVSLNGGLESTPSSNICGYVSPAQKSQKTIQVQNAFDWV